MVHYSAIIALVSAENWARVEINLWTVASSTVTTFRLIRKSPTRYRRKKITTRKSHLFATAKWKTVIKCWYTNRVAQPTKSYYWHCKKLESRTLRKNWSSCERKIRSRWNHKSACSRPSVIIGWNLTIGSKERSDWVAKSKVSIKIWKDDFIRKTPIARKGKTNTRKNEWGNQALARRNK